MGAMQPWHWIVLLVVVLLLFGSTRLPGLAKSVGQSMKIFKSEINDLREDKDKKDVNDSRVDAAPNTTATPNTTAATAQPVVKDDESPKA
ncbi:Sec-independent protein translocase subunit TatA [Antribacter gilvus]|uniref:Sec-independent protein translocase subunit TatA n=1 Tax=Antribacter gilvus TaxID=2304675 RepID=UPI000F7A2AF7|nr:Sec-independent protein translocase subunit TatA [Antribacter gilvus]